MNRPSVVAQVGNLLFRRLAVGWATNQRAAADCQSAIEQTTNLRYGSLKLTMSFSTATSRRHDQQDERPQPKPHMKKIHSILPLVLASITLTLLPACVSTKTPAASRPFVPIKLGTLRALAIDPAGNIYVGDEADFIIRKISKEGNVTTVAGKVGEKGSQDGKGSAARFAGPRGFAADAAGNLFIADGNNSAMRMITPDGWVTTVIGVLPPTTSVPAATSFQT